MAQLDDVVFVEGVCSLDEAQEAVGRLEVDVMVMDVQMPGVVGGGVLATIVSTGVRVVLFTLREEDALVASLVAGGASAFVPKSVSPPALMAVIRRVHAGEDVIPESLQAAVRATETPPHQSLTEREREVFVCLARCQTPKEIAFDMGVSQSTVYTHADRVRRKLGVATLAEVVQYAREWAVELE